MRRRATANRYRADSGSGQDFDTLIAEQRRKPMVTRTQPGTESTQGRTPGTDRTSQLYPLGLVEFVLMARRSGAVDLATGVPSFPAPPRALLDGACEAILHGNNQYDDPAGNDRLRAAAAALHGADPDTEITVTGGSTEGLNTALQALVQPGDEVVVIEPFFEAYPSAIRLAGAVPRFVRLREPHWRWRPEELEAAFGPRTRAVVVNSPHNPTGRVLDAAELSAVLELCERWNAVVISDEVYAELVDRPEDLVLPGDLPGAADRVVALRSLSKSHAVSGWRIGWIYAPASLTRTFRMIHETFTAGVAAPLQAAAVQILRDSPRWTQEQRTVLTRNRARIVAALREVGLQCDQPQGSAFLLARLPDELEEDSMAFARRIIAEIGVSGAPGGLFYSPSRDGARHLRFGYNKAEPVISAAIERLGGLRAPGAPAPARGGAAAR